MKHVVAIVLLCLPAQLSALGRCPYAAADRAEIARTWNAKAPSSRALARAQKIRAILAYQRALLFEQQIL
jgi:hypothetical protein